MRPFARNAGVSLFEDIFKLRVAVALFPCSFFPESLHEYPANVRRELKFFVAGVFTVTHTLSIYLTYVKCQGEFLTYANNMLAI